MQNQDSNMRTVHHELSELRVFCLALRLELAILTNIINQTACCIPKYMIITLCSHI